MNSFETTDRKPASQTYRRWANSFFLALVPFTISSWRIHEVDFRAMCH